MPAEPFLIVGAIAGNRPRRAGCARSRVEHGEHDDDFNIENDSSIVILIPGSGGMNRMTASGPRSSVKISASPGDPDLSSDHDLSSNDPARIGVKILGGPSSPAIRELRVNPYLREAFMV